MSERIRLIINGKSAGDEALRAAVQRLREQGVGLGVRVTWEAGDVDRLVHQALADRVPTIAVAGGDGTLSEVVSALAEQTHDLTDAPSLGLLPMGTANDFAVACGLPIESHAALSQLLEVEPRPIDLVRVEAHGARRWMANLASGGFGTQVTVETPEGMKKVLGGLAYLLTGLAKLGRIEPVEIELEGPEFAWRGACIALGLGNGRQAGGGQVLCPDARLDDGLFDVTVIPELGGEVGAALGTVLTAGKDAAFEQVTVRAQLPWLELRAASKFTLNLDGEPFEAERFRLECVPARVRMHLPQGCPLLGAREA